MLGFPSFSQNPSDSSSVVTPFRKGRWLTGLSGSISSGSNSLDSIGSGIDRNQYNIELGTGNFVRDRLLIGGIISLSRSNSDEIFFETSELLFIGPVITWYLSNEDHGSLFLSATGGYAKFREESGYNLNGSPFAILIDGNGGGGQFSFGYSHVLHDRVSFDLKLGYALYWIGANVLEQPANISRRKNFTVGDLSFSFGFNVLLDKFFF